MIRFSLSKSTRQSYQPKKVDINRWLRQSLLHKYKTVYIDISIVNSKTSKQLNQRFRQKDYPTNVISFEYSNTRDDFAMLTGELILCNEVIVEEANTQNKTIMAHYAHMIVHGLLHLQGFDHIEDNDAEHMEAQEVKILNTLGFDNPYKITDKI